MRPTLSLLLSWRPGTLAEAGARLRTCAASTDDLGRRVQGCGDSLGGGWTGQAAATAASAADDAGAHLALLADALVRAASALDLAAEGVRRVQTQAHTLLRHAAAEGCSVGDDGLVRPPPARPLPSAPTPDVLVMWQAQADADRARQEDLAAHLTRRLRGVLDEAEQADAAGRRALDGLRPPATPRLPGPTGLGAPGGTSVDGSTAPGLVLQSFSRLDADGDGEVGVRELQAAAEDGRLDPDLRAAARYLLDNPVLAGQVATGDHPLSVAPDGESVGGHGLPLRREAVRTFVLMQPHTRVLAENAALLGLAGGATLGLAGLARRARDRSLPAEVRAAARFFVTHPTAFGRLATGREAAVVPSGPLPREPEDQVLDLEDLVARAVDDQVTGGDSAAAHRLVATLPVPERGERGLTLGLVSDEGFAMVTNRALAGAGSSFRARHEVISRLPETSSGRRNRLITASYSEMGQEMDRRLAGPLAGRPGEPGHPGANWMTFAPWASDGVRDVITGDFSVHGLHPGHEQRQWAAAGNQWIYADVGAAYASFLDFTAENPDPTPEQWARYLEREFDDGDAAVRTAMAGYAEVVSGGDPSRAQQTLYAANVQIAAHEQNGVQEALERLSVGPDRLATRYIDIDMGDHHLDVDQPVPAGPRADGWQDPSFLALPGAGTGATDVAPTALRGQTLTPIAGEELYDEDFPVLLEEMRRGGAPEGDGDSLEGSGASSWADPHERMYYLARLLEQMHADPSLFAPEERLGLHAGSEEYAWLDGDLGLLPSRPA